ncbi:MAG: aspartate kinase [Bacteroidales bacterium]|nr:aspartate kinase [Bacteroidales bacterium]
MNKTVVKFGGSNLKSPEDFEKILRVVDAYPHPIIIIVSAFFGVTSALDEFLRSNNLNSKSIMRLRKHLWHIHRNALEANIEDPGLLEETFEEVNNRIIQLERYLLGIHYIGKTPSFAIDSILSYGERLSSCVLRAILSGHGFASREIFPEQLKLTTVDDHFSDSVDFNISEGPVKSFLAEDCTWVIPGFYGITRAGEVALFGRGGSDYSAAAIARCVGARSLDLWKDVDGFMTTDPEIVINPKGIQHLTYAEAAELAYFGAKVLHPRTVEPLSGKKIPIHIYNINKPDIQNPLTIINGSHEKENGTIKSITATSDISILKIKGEGVGILPGLLARVTQALDEQHINIKSVQTTQTAINLLLSPADLKQAARLVGQLQLALIMNIEYIDEIVLIALVGDGILKKPGIINRMVSVVACKGINIEMISFGASDVATYFIVKKEHRDIVIKDLHREFFP